MTTPPLATLGFVELACSPTDDTACGWLARRVGSESVAEAIAFALGTPLFIAAVLVAALVIRWFGHRAIRRTVDRVVSGRRGFTWSRLDLLERVDRMDPIAAERRTQRARAIGSLLTATVSVAVWTLALFVILPEIGVEIAGLLAGAGIVGLTVAFGAQTLISDLVSGVFMIAEDQFGVGDVIDMGEASGVVEAVGLRTTRLRAIDGTVWHVRNGEVTRVGNMSQGWSRVVLDLEVAYTEDVAHVMSVLTDLGRGLYADPDFAPRILEEPEVWGVEAFGKDSMIIRTIIKTHPLEQWGVAREMRRRIKDGFDRADIDFPYAQPEVWVRTEGPTATDQDAGGH